MAVGLSTKIRREALLALYPVARGDVWRVGAVARVGCLDAREVTLNGFAKRLLDGRVVSEVRTSLPRGPADVTRAFRLAGIVGYRVHFPDFLRRAADLLVSLAAGASARVVMGAPWLATWSALADARGFATLGVTVPEEEPNRNGASIVEWTGRIDGPAMPDGVATCLLDPFCGEGSYLVEAVAAGHDAIGTELVAWRAAAALGALGAAAGGVAPELG